MVMSGRFIVVALAMLAASVSAQQTHVWPAVEQHPVQQPDSVPERPAVVPPLTRQASTILFRAPYGATTWNQPSDTWWEQADAFGRRWSAARVAGAGPAGQDVVQLTELAGTGQHGWGWHGHVVPDLEVGGRRFFRFRHRVLSCSRSTSNKLLVIAQGCSGGSCRVIIQPRCNGAGQLQYNFQVDGGVFQKETGYRFPVGVWHSIQLEVDAATGNTASDGALTEWIDTDDYANPTLFNVGIPLRNGASEGSYIIFGGYNNNDDWPAGAQNVQQYTDLEIATAFDPQWHARASGPVQTPTPPTPLNFRLVP